MYSMCTGCKKVFEGSPPLCGTQSVLFTLCISVCIMDVHIRVRERAHSLLTKQNLKTLPSWWGKKRGKILPAVIWASVLTRRSHSEASYPRRKSMKYSCRWRSEKKQHNEVVTGPNECPRAHRASGNIWYNETALPPWSTHPELWRNTPLRGLPGVHPAHVTSPPQLMLKHHEIFKELTRHIAYAY